MREPIIAYILHEALMVKQLKFSVLIMSSLHSIWVLVLEKYHSSSIYQCKVIVHLEWLAQLNSFFLKIPTFPISTVS